MVLNVLDEIKKDLEGFLGLEVSIKANSGRKKITRQEGVLEKTYPRVFVVRVDEDTSPRRLSYSYADILTETVEVTVKGNKTRIGQLKV